MPTDTCNCNGGGEKRQAVAAAAAAPAVNGDSPISLLLLRQRQQLQRKPIEAPILSRVGDKSPPGTLKRVQQAQQPSCRNWCSTYSQSFLNKTIHPTQEEDNTCEKVEVGIADD
jgi:hypothetical protein